MIRGRCRRRTGIGWRTAVSNATCARAPAGCTRASGGCASCGAGRTADQVVLTSYGRSSGFCVDPVEKKPLNHFLPGTPVLSFGTAGCNLACRFCQNWDISKSREVDTLAAAASPEALADTAWSLGCRSVAFTYNDPTIFLEYAIDAADACHQRGIKAIAVTAGYIEPAARRDLYAHMDAANVDLKAFTEELLPQGLRRAPGERAGHPAVPASPDRGVAGDHHVADPGPQPLRLRRRDRRGGRVGPGQPRHRRAAALHRVPPGLQDARRAADATGHPGPGPADRHRRRAAVRVHRQRPR